MILVDCGTLFGIMIDCGGIETPIAQPFDNLSSVIGCNVQTGYIDSPTRVIYHATRALPSLQVDENLYFHI